MKFKEVSPLASSEAAERKLLELANAIEADHAGRISVGAINKQFQRPVAATRNMGVKAAIAHGWLTMHSSGGYLTLTQAGAELFA
jgi:hypothetical protein